MKCVQKLVRRDGAATSVQALGKVSAASVPTARGAGVGSSASPRLMQPRRPSEETRYFTAPSCPAKPVAEVGVVVGRINHRSLFGWDLGSVLSQSPSVCFRSSVRYSGSSTHR